MTARAAALALALLAAPVAAQEAGPAGAWRLVSLGPVFLAPTETGRSAEMIFDAEAGTFSASLGCNQFAGGFTADGEGLTFADAIVSTKMLCTPPLDRLEATFSALLPDVRGFAVAEGAAALLDGDGAALAILVAAE